MIAFLPDSAEIHAIAARVIWFEPPQKALSDLPRFLAYAFRYATHEDMKILRTYLSDDDLRQALAAAPSGIIDARSWSYWHALLGIYPAPPMPQRVLDSSSAS